MSNKRVAQLLALTVVITAFVTFALTSAVFTGKFLLSGDAGDKVTKALDILDSKFYGDVDRESATDAALRGLTDNLGDPYTSYMSKSEWDEFNEIMSGSYSGIGVVISADEADDTIVVISAMDGSPAKGAGIQPGDKIIAVEGEKATGRELDAATARIKGKKGTDVTITLLKKDTSEEKDITLKRDDITLETVAYKKIDDIGYIRIALFDMTTGDEFKEKLSAAMSEGIKGLVVDVRQNGGGITTAVEQVVSSLIPKDLVIYYTKDKAGNEVYHKTDSAGIDIPIAVLVDGGTASASEILSASIKDNGRGFLVGEKTFGKGSVQQPVPLGDGSYLKVTIERYFTPNGTDIHQHGIEPDYYAQLTENPDVDEQLDKAVEILKQQF